MKNKITFKTWTKEELEQASIDAYNEDRSYPENFSNWYPYIKDFGQFKHAEIISNQIFTYEEVQEMQKSDIISNIDFNKINEILKPTLDKMKPGKFYNIKNGCFSNKFDFNTCIVTKENLAEQLWKINYTSACLSTGGYTELVVRELIPYNKELTPTIYNGMPLREEIRVFYNMNTKEIEYMEDYWNYNYCYNQLHNKTDRIIFDYFHNINPGRFFNHKHLLSIGCKLINKYIKDLKFTDKLNGIWSIDFMCVLNKDTFNMDIYLIDMARGFRSAYWDITKIKGDK